jgi:hypothetical protein
MQDFPHHYFVVASGSAEGNTTLEGTGLPTLRSAPPSEFGGPGDRWSRKHSLSRRSPIASS